MMEIEKKFKGKMMFLGQDSRNRWYSCYNYLKVLFYIFNKSYLLNVCFIFSF